MRTNVLITGASSGLGAEMARIFAGRGHRLALCARRADRLEELADALRRDHQGLEVHTYALDVDDHDQVFAVFDRAAEDMGGLDRVIVNAGIGTGARIGTGGFAANRDTARTNFLGALAQCEAAMAQFYERRSGHLVLVSSVAAVRGMPGAMAAYSASKAGLTHLAEGVRADVRRRGEHAISVTTIHPGYIRTELHGDPSRRPPMTVDLATGCQAMVAQIDKEVGEAYVPSWPWAPVAFVLRHAPAAVVRRLL